MPTEAEIEYEIQRKGLTATRLDPAMIDATIVTQQYYQFPDTVMTVCCLTLRNGYNVIGKSAPASPKNFDAELGRKIAFDDARRQIWALEGYALKEKMQ